MASRRRALLYSAYLVLCAELAAKALFLLPWTRARLPPELELSWRARWVGRYLFTDRTVFYGFDDYHPRLGWTLRRNLRGFRQFPGSTVSSNSGGARGVEEYAPGAIRPLVSEDQTMKLAPVIELIRQVREERTGVNRYTQGMEAPKLETGSYGGLLALQGAANKRIKFVARIFAQTGVKDMMCGIAGLLKEHQRQFLTFALGGGEQAYKGRNLTEAHTRLSITDAAFDKVAWHLRLTLEELDVERSLIMIISGFVEGARAQVVSPGGPGQTARPRLRPDATVRRGPGPPGRRRSARRWLGCWASTDGRVRAPRRCEPAGPDAPDGHDRSARSAGRGRSRRPRTGSGSPVPERRAPRSPLRAGPCRC